MAAKRYQLTPDVIASWWTESGQFNFHVGFDKDDGKCICGPLLCPQITITDTDIVQTTNVTAQEYLLASRIPQGVVRDGVALPGGPMWLDVTATQPIANVDLDPYFPT